MNSDAPQTVIVCGVSGVGKTYQIRSVIERLPEAITWSASEIIGEARRNTDPEYLRSLPEDELARSQEMLVYGFTRRVQAVGSRLVLLDAHCVLDTDTGMFEISTEVMRRLGPLGFIHLDDQVGRILERRTCDSKKRPARTKDQLHLYQERSRAVCRAFAAALGKPVLEVRSGDTEGFLNAIRTLLRSKRLSDY
jgi:adenylate kinase